MGYDEKTAARIRKVLATRDDVGERKMFGGLCFMVNDRMCVGLTSDALMVRVGPDNHEDALTQPHTRPMDFTGRVVRGFVFVDPPGFATPASLARWVKRGVDFALTAPAPRPKRKRPRFPKAVKKRRRLA
jgi:TfoX/Sxy family transcriptional regulator of competence genes